MAKSGKKASRKKVVKVVLISLAVFIVLNLIGAAVGTSTSITHPSRESYENRIKYVKDNGLWGNFDSYDKQDYRVSGLDGYQLNCTCISSKETKGTGKYVIISHGHKSNKYAMVKFVDPYIELGFTCIIYDQRAHGENAKALCSMGGWEAQDLNYLIEDTYSRFKDVKILGLQGESMGSSTSLNVLRYTDKVDFIVSDCAMESLRYMVHDMYNFKYRPENFWYHLEEFIGGDTCIQGLTRMLSDQAALVIITAGSRTLQDYMLYSNVVSQEHPSDYAFSNIEGAIGVFASKMTRSQHVGLGGTTMPRLIADPRWGFKFSGGVDP